MSKVIIFDNGQGGVGVIYPTDEGLKAAGGDILVLAKKDVPTDCPFKVVDVSEIPTDRTFRAAWTIDPAELTHGVGNVSNKFELPPTTTFEA